MLALLIHCFVFILFVSSELNITSDMLKRALLLVFLSYNCYPLISGDPFLGLNYLFKLEVELLFPSFSKGILIVNFGNVLLSFFLGVGGSSCFCEWTLFEK